jgi:hypothetical protein
LTIRYIDALIDVPNRVQPGVRGYTHSGGRPKLPTRYGAQVLSQNLKEFNSQPPRTNATASITVDINHYMDNNILEGLGSHSSVVLGQACPVRDTVQHVTIGDILTSLVPFPDSPTLPSGRYTS